MSLDQLTRDAYFPNSLSPASILFNIMLTPLTIFTLLVSAAIAEDGTMQASVNPGCHKCTSDDQLVYAKAGVMNQSVHHLWSSLSDDYPTFLLAQSSENESMAINWDKLLKGSNGSINGSSIVNDVALVVKDIRFWNDTQKSGVFNHSDPSTTKNLAGQIFQKNVTLTKDGHSAKAVLVFSEVEESNVTVTLILSAAASEGRADDLPHLLMSPTSFHVQIIITGDPRLNYTNCRIVLDMDVFHRTGNVTIGSETTIDDEFSPGVFAVSTAHINAQDDSQSFITWKSVAYNKVDRIIAHTVDTNVKFGEPKKSTGGKVITGFFSDRDFQVSSLNVSFGGAKDSFYTEFNSFSFVVGVGVPAKDGLSFLVQLIIWIGFGIPALALIVAAVYLTVKRMRRSRASREPLLRD